MIDVGMQAERDAHLMLHQEKSEGRAAARALRPTGKAAAGYARKAGGAKLAHLRQTTRPRGQELEAAYENGTTLCCCMNVAENAAAI